MDVVNPPSSVEPTEWYVIFHPSTTSPLLSFLAFGHFKHVSAIGYYAGFKVWLLFDARRAGMRVPLIAHESMKAVIGEYTEGCTLVKFARRPDPIGMAPHLRLGFFCVTAVKHLLGVRCPTLRPDGLFRHLMKHGGTVINGHAEGGSGATNSRRS